jgi:hypothetical protein
MHTLSVGAMFKNEEAALGEWLDHYIHHGVQHFYLIDDKSTDESVSVVKPYIDRGYVSLFVVDHPYYLGRQHDLYNKHILPNISETRLLIVDLDEFMWSPRAIDLKEVLAQLDHVAQVQVTHTLFGSNGHDTRPTGGLVASYTRRARHCPTEVPGNHKYFINSTRADVSSLGVHHAEFVRRDDAPYYMMDASWFILNHYCCQSREFWRETKCTRGDADEYRVRTMADFEQYDLNDVEDIQLLEQNRRIRERPCQD